MAVPTPITDANQPDLTPMLLASETVGKALKKGDIIVYESTVYPGVTEEECVPVLERVSGLVCGVDFTVGYSHERSNPGDKEHTFTRITEVVSGQDAATLEIVAGIYESLVTAGVHRAGSIRVAEAAKVIENTQSCIPRRISARPPGCLGITRRIRSGRVHPQSGKPGPAARSSWHAAVPGVLSSSAYAMRMRYIA